MATYSAAVCESSEARDCWEKLLLRPVTRSVLACSMDSESIGGGVASPDMVGKVRLKCDADDDENDERRIRHREAWQ